MFLLVTVAVDFLVNVSSDRGSWLVDGAGRFPVEVIGPLGDQ